MRSYDGGYRRFLRRSFGRKLTQNELRHDIGGEFEAFGIVEREILKFYGLQSTDYLVDVGCGAGRLVAALRDWFVGSYLGTDVVGSLIAESSDLAPRNWTFVKVDATRIPCSDQSVDVVCFFSIFTHLQLEDCYGYLQEARRVLRAGGRIVFSFLEFREASHWGVFARSMAGARAGNNVPLTIFLSREAIDVWASHLDLRIVDFRDGSDRFVPLPHPIKLQSGVVLEKYGSLGQSICVLERP